MLIDKASRLGLRPIAARGTSPPSGRAGLRQALHTRASNSGPLPAAVEATRGCPMSKNQAADNEDTAAEAGNDTPKLRERRKYLRPTESESMGVDQALVLVARSECDTARGPCVTFAERRRPVLGVSSRRYGRRRAEILADTVTYVVLAGQVGLDVGDDSIPYSRIAGDA
jgi:hypothetical protein